MISFLSAMPTSAVAVFPKYLRGKTATLGEYPPLEPLYSYFSVAKAMKNIEFSFIWVSGTWLALYMARSRHGLNPQQKLPG
nr:hypothetical protein [Pseudomonas luteola]